MTTVLEFIRLKQPLKTDSGELIFEGPREQDAYESYKKIYNEVMVRGHGTLEPQSLMGDPIQMDMNNFSSLVTNEYFVSTKADGLRFLMMFSDGTQRAMIDRLEGVSKIGEKTNYRNIYFIDNNTNIWYIKRKTGEDDKGPSGELPGLLNIAKCLIDGELLFWGLIERIFDDDGSIVKYIIKKDGNTQPFVTYLAFDILYGPTNPEFETEKELKSRPIPSGMRENMMPRPDPSKLVFGSSGAMLGFKGAERWPTEDRRQILETMFNNQYSHLIRYLNDLASFDFTVLVSPFVPMELMLEKPDPYDYMKRIYKEELDKQFIRNTKKYIPYTQSRKITDSELVSMNPVFKEIDQYETLLNLEKRSKSIGKGVLDDGLIFTPKYLSYLMGPWSFCNNKQYKWKPPNELTIDFQVGEQLESDEVFKYVAMTRNDQQFKFKDKKVFILSEEPLVIDSIVETSVSEFKKNKINFGYVQTRYDKRIPNAYRTSLSVMNAIIMERKGVDIFSLIEKMRNKEEFTNSETEKYVSLLSPGTLFKCLISLKNEGSDNLLNPLLKNLEQQDTFLSYIDQAKNDRNLELESRITFKSEHRQYALCLISKTIGRKYDPVPVIKAYGNLGYRSSYTPLGFELFYESTMIKNDLESFKLNVQRMKNPETGETIFLYDQVDQVKVTLASEKPVNLGITEKAQTTVVDIEEISKKKDCDCDSWGCENCFGKEETTIKKETKPWSKKEVLNLFKRYLNSYGVVDIPKSLEFLEKKLKDHVIKDSKGNETLISGKEPIEIINEYLSTIDDIPFKNNLYYNYQNRYVINKMSLFWRVDIIEYGMADDWILAEEILDSGPSNETFPDGRYDKKKGARTRIEIEFDPASYYVDFLKFYKENPDQKTFLAMVELLEMNADDFKDKSKGEVYKIFENAVEFIKEKLYESDSKDILQDYITVLTGILNAFYS